MTPAASLLIMGVVAFAVAAGGLAASAVISPNKYSKTKIGTYECGIQPTQAQASDGRFPVKYYLVAMTFIIFDIEVVFIYPWAVSLAEFRNVPGGEFMGVVSLVAILLFIGLITVPFIYEWRRGGFDF